jgi:cellulose synthase (UDP-forming)
MALREVGGLAPHDADDLLITLHYRAKGWEGVYVSEILARGLTPVNWSGYLTQQRRWARSVLDVKIRLYPKLSRHLTLRSRVMGFLHGLHFLHKGFTLFTAVLLLLFMLATGINPKVVSFAALPKFAILWMALQLCEFYRQRFYLDWRSEWGFHWRAGLLQWAKWPHMLLGLCDVIFLRRFAYVLTSKTEPAARKRMLSGPLVAVVILICAAWIVGAASGRTVNPLLQIGAAVVVTVSAALILTEFLDFPPPYNKSLRPNDLSPVTSSKGSAANLSEI